MVYNLTPWWFPGIGSPTSSTQTVGSSQGTGYTAGSSEQQATSKNQAVSQQGSTSTGRSTSQQSSSTYIPEYSQTPILENIAKYSANMAPQVYQWGMGQFNKNQGNIDNMMRDAQSYASPQRQAQEMGMAQAGVMQGAEQGRQNSIRDLQSYGIDPSSGRYSALDSANRTMAGAMAAGAGNQQRMATEATGNAMRNQAIAATNQNVQTGYGAAGAANQLLGTGMSLKYAPLGTMSQGTSDSSQDASSFGTSTSSGESQSTGSSANLGQNQTSSSNETLGSSGPLLNQFGSSGMGGMGGMNTRMFAKGGYIPDEISPSHGGSTDDVPANLNAGEFIIPKDVVEFKGKEFFYKLMAQSRKMRAMHGGDGHVGYGAG
jgi:hypothetical protein